MGDYFSPKRRDVVDRLRRRIEVYRRRQNGCHQRYEFGQKTIYDQQKQTALFLRQKWLDSKAKKTSKSKTKSDSSHPDHRNQIVTVSDLVNLCFDTCILPSDVHVLLQEVGPS